MRSWTPALQGREGPRYLAIADAIAADIAAGRLAPGDRLPPQRDLARRRRARFHHGRARLCRGGKARAAGIGRRTRHLRPAQRDGARRGRPAPFARRLLDEHAAGARRSRSARADARGLRQRGGRSRLAAALPGIWRLAARPRCGVRLARPPRAGALAGTPVRDARARMARWSASSACWRKPARRSFASRSPIPASARSARSSAFGSSASRWTATASFPMRSTRRSARMRRRRSISTRPCKTRRRHDP